MPLASRNPLKKVVCDQVAEAVLSLDAIGANGFVHPCVATRVDDTMTHLRVTNRRTGKDREFVVKVWERRA
jgi:hypothetical protein